MDMFLSTGMTLGLSAGFSPGPLSTLVISHSLRHGTREGLKVAMAPFLTDVPIILVSVLALAQLRESQTAFGLISILGAAVVFYLSYSTFRVGRVDAELDSAEAHSLGKGALVNFLSPHPYLFWLTIGGPQVVEAWMQSPWKAAGFLGGFYVCLIGSKMLMAFLASRSRRLLAGKIYQYVMRILGGALIILGFILLKEGLVFLQVLPR
jgi:threonine/homoserine/homoserine lactone efflux protein